MTFTFPQKAGRRRRLIIRDRRGLPAKQVSLQHAGRCFDLLMYWAQRNGICVITEAGKPVVVLIALDHDKALTALIYATIAVAAARRRNPGGVFTLADEVFGSRARTDWWMAQEIWSLAGNRPVDKLATDRGVEEVLNILHRIQHGTFA